jgi:DNA topoisomerase 2-associated protein PAT1
LTGDKEFITRIQLSQLVTQDPYTSDFYAQVHSAITRARLAAVGAAPNNGADGPTVLPVGPDGRGLGVGVVRGQGGPKRLKETAMQRMTVQVKRIVENAQKRAVAAPSGEYEETKYWIIVLTKYCFFFMHYSFLAGCIG